MNSTTTSAYATGAGPRKLIGRMQRSVLRLSCAINGADNDLMATSPKTDQLACIRDMLLLGNVFVISSVCWTLYFRTFMGLRVALAAGLFVGWCIFMLDVAVGCSHRSPESFLRDRPPWWRSARKYGPRIAITIMLSSVSAGGITQYMCREAIAKQHQQTLLQQNAPVAAKYEALKREARMIDGRRREAIEHRREDAVAQLARSRANVSQLAAEIKEHQQNVAYWTEQQLKEDRGIERKSGQGPLYDLATLKLGLEQGAAERAQVRLEAAVADIKNLDTELTRIEAEIDHLMRESEERLAALDQKMLSDPAFVDAQTDTLLNFMAFWHLRRSPEHGAAVASFYFTAMLLISVLELSYVLVKFFFPTPQLYPWRLRYRTELAVIEEKVQLRHAIAEIKQRARDLDSPA